MTKHKIKLPQPQPIRMQTIIIVKLLEHLHLVIIEESRLQMNEQNVTQPTRIQSLSPDLVIEHAI